MFGLKQKEFDSSSTRSTDFLQLKLVYILVPTKSSRRFILVFLLSPTDCICAGKRKCNSSVMPASARWCVSTSGLFATGRIMIIGAAMFVTVRPIAALTEAANWLHVGKLIASAAGEVAPKTRATLAEPVVTRAEVVLDAKDTVSFR